MMKHLSGPALLPLRAIVFALGAALLTASATALRAQVVSVPDSNAQSGRFNLVPLGGKNGGANQDIRTQILVPASFFPKAGSVIRDLAFVPEQKGAYFYSRFFVRFAHLPVSQKHKLSKVFAQNLAGSLSLLDKKPFRYGFSSGSAWHRVGLSKTFRHDGKRDLVVDIVIRGAFFNGTKPGSRRSSTLQTVYASAYDGKQGKGFGPFLAGAKMQFVLGKAPLSYVGTGCKASNGKSPLLTLSAAPTLGGRSTAELADLVPKQAALLLFGLSDRQYGSLKLPFALDKLGAKGCTLRSEIVLIMTSVAGSKGLASFPLSFPGNTKFQGQVVSFQGLLLDSKANNLGLVLSRLALGKL